MMQQCFHCESDRLVWDWTNGDIICTSCGTVNQESIIDDKVYYKDYEDHEYQEHKTIDKKVVKVVSKINSVLYNGMVDDTNRISDKIQSTCDNNNRITTADVVAGVYACEKGLTANNLCTAMNIKPKMFWKSVKTNVVWENRLLDIIKRLVYESVDFDTKKEWSVIKCCMKVIEKIKSCPEIQNIKTDKLAISLIYIACKCEKIPYDKKQFVQVYKISLETLKRHEHVIQTILTNRSK